MIDFSFLTHYVVVGFSSYLFTMRIIEQYEQIGYPSGKIIRYQRSHAQGRGRTSFIINNLYEFGVGLA